MRTTRNPLADDYLKRLRRAASRLPRSRRAELVAAIEQHLDEAVPPEASDAETLTALDRLGEPEEIVAAEAPHAADPRGTQEWAAILLLLFGGLAAGLGWLAGLIFLWGSRAWTTREKWIGTLVVPGGLLLPMVLLGMSVAPAGETCVIRSDGSQVCTGVEGRDAGDVVLLVLLAVSVIAPIATAFFLARRAGRPHAAGA
jgi:hypothetical protein